MSQLFNFTVKIMGPVALQEVKVCLNQGEICWDPQELQGTNSRCFNQGQSSEMDWGVNDPKNAGKTW